MDTVSEYTYIHITGVSTNNVNRLGTDPVYYERGVKIVEINDGFINHF